MVILEKEIDSIVSLSPTGFDTFLRIILCI